MFSLSWIFCVNLDISNLFIWWISSSPVVFVPSLQNCERIWYAAEIKEWFPAFANFFDIMRHCFAMLFSGIVLLNVTRTWGCSNRLWALKMFAQLELELGLSDNIGSPFVLKSKKVFIKLAVKSFYRVLSPFIKQDSVCHTHPISLRYTII